MQALAINIKSPMMYYPDMNIKRGRDLARIKLGRLDITKRDLINLEKIILKRIKPMDSIVIIGKQKGLYKKGAVVFSSARYIPNEVTEYKYSEIRTKRPNISISFNSRSAEITVQRIYQKGDSLKVLDETVIELKKYLLTIK